MSNIKAFQIIVNGKTLDYRLGNMLDLDQTRAFFEKKYKVIKIWPGGRHVFGTLEKNNKTLFLKLATTEGMSELTKNEFKWNEQFNKLIPRKLSKFWVPKNIDFGVYNGNLFYLITDNFEGELFVQKPAQSEISSFFQSNINYIIEFSELIQSLNLANLSIEESPNFRNSFLEKTNAWYESVPENIQDEFQINKLLRVVKNGIGNLSRKPRHGDFTPWHLMKLKSGQLGLIDGEHAKKNGVEYYDIGYFIQRVFSVLQNPTLAEQILSQLIKRNYSLEKFKIILAARAIGGFLDESLNPKPNYQFSNKFNDWVISLN